MGAREFLNSRPWLGWVVASVVLVIAIFIYWKMRGGNDPYSVERLSQTVTIRCAETGREWEMERGLLERELRRRPGLLSTDEGIVNPETGRPTGFPVDKLWADTVKRINEEKREYDPALKNAPEPKPAPKEEPAPQGD